MYCYQVLDKKYKLLSQIIHFLSNNVVQVVPKSSKILNISKCNHRLSSIIVILLNLKDKGQNCNN